MRISGAYGTHLPALMRTLDKTKGNVLELGVGLFSTPYLHYRCLLEDRLLLSYDNDKGWVKKFTGKFGGYKYENPGHYFGYVPDWNNFEINGLWSVVLVDNSPDYDRNVLIKKVATSAEYVVIHDSNERHEDKYHYSEIYPLFKYKKVWTEDDRFTTVLSNSHELEDLW